MFEVIDMKIILVSSLLKYNIQMPLKKTFGDEPYYICQIPVKTGLCYSNKNDIEELKKVIRESVDSLSNVFKTGEVYIIASGGVLHNCYLIEILKEYGLRFNYLIYNKVDDKYYIDDGYNSVVDSDMVKFMK